MNPFFYQKLFIPAFIAILGLSRCHSEKNIAPQVKDTIKIGQVAASDAGLTPLKNMFGVNSYEWNFLENPAAPNDRNHIYEANMTLIKSFSAVRHYMNWNQLENTQGDYTYNPTNRGSWYYDVIYARCKADGILVLADMKNLPEWMMNSYPADQRDDENTPVYFGANKSLPKSYLVQAQTAFQFAARYGYNIAVTPSLVKANTKPRWNNDTPNQVKIGMGLIKYIECNNEPDRWWKGDKATQTPEEYAANLSAFYDGHKGALGNNAGVKTADPNMMVVMGGLATADAKYVQRVIDWCKKNRGYRPNGKVNLCFDVINYHLYSNNGSVLSHIKATTGVAPELSESGKIADDFMKVAKDIPVWVTETGYDINQASYQHAPPIGTKTELITQADWILRTSLMYIRHGIKRVFFYQLFDANAGSGEQYATSGLAEGVKMRPSGDYILQVNKLMGNYGYKGTLNADPVVDMYQLDSKLMYVLSIPDQKNRKAVYTLDLGKATSATVYTLTPGAKEMSKKDMPTANGKLKLTVTETPMFVQAK
ncbi:hypothetical protein FFF34_005600 [Inquilinus sp. KBS0705]|nr:hypothetical protein FFF34_005600 [Inquilinus sp. KBS0705]